MSAPAKRKSLLFKVMAPSLALIVTGFAAVGLATAWTRAENAAELFQRKVELSASLSQPSVANALWEVDAKEMREAVAPIRKDPDHKFVWVVDQDGRTFYAGGDGRLQALAADVVKAKRPDRRPWSMTRGRYLLSVAPLTRYEYGGAEPLGNLVVVYDTSSVTTAVWSAVIGVGLIGLVVIALTVALLYGLLRRITLPLDDLSGAMGALARGELDTAVAGLDRNDEVGAMARAVQVFKENAQTLERARGESARLLEARTRAEAASAAKTEFLAHMSHELRTPLNGVLTMAQVMARGELEAEQRDKLNVILSSGQDLLLVINDVLDISKIEQHKLELEQVAFDPVEVVETACQAFAVLAEGKDLALHVELDEAARGRRLGDPVRLRQIVNNFVANAIKFTEAGSVSVSVTDGGPGGCEGLTLAVRDTGPGISPEGMQRLFQRFSQVDASITRRFGGTGLGLAICHELAGLMGGRVWAESTLGAGSTFYAGLPLPRVEAASEPARAGPPAEAGAAGTVGRLRVLAAEDNPTNHAVLRAIMAAFGCELVLARNGREAVEAWVVEEFDLILMDVQMPDMDGIAATRAIRAEEARSGSKRTPIIALSANAFRHQIEAYKAAGMDDHVSKPIDVTTLQLTMERVLEHRVSGQPPVSGAA
jgi:signal transduction histidine kinase/ActR/RegA family two-component response regulator